MHCMDDMEVASTGARRSKGIASTANVATQAYRPWSCLPIRNFWHVQNRIGRNDSAFGK